MSGKHVNKKPMPAGPGWSCTSEGTWGTRTFRFKCCPDCNPCYGGITIPQKNTIVHAERKSSTIYPVSEEVVLISKPHVRLRSPKSWLVRSSKSSAQTVSQLRGSGTRRAMDRLQRAHPPAGVGASCIRAHPEWRRIHGGVDGAVVA